MAGTRQYCLAAGSYKNDAANMYGADWGVGSDGQHHHRAGAHPPHEHCGRVPQPGGLFRPHVPPAHKGRRHKDGQERRRRHMAGCRSVQGRSCVMPHTQDDIILVRDTQSRPWTHQQVMCGSSSRVHECRQVRHTFQLLRDIATSHETHHASHRTRHDFTRITCTENCRRANT